MNSPSLGVSVLAHNVGEYLVVGDVMACGLGYALVAFTGERDTLQSPNLSFIFLATA